mgnify:CR=1 FL=1|jgi:hypothetical protein
MMMNLLLVLAALFIALALVVKLLEGRAQPLTAQQQQRLSRWLMVLVAASLLLSLLHQAL